MSTRKSNVRVPDHLTPEIYGGYIQGLAIYRAGEAATVSVASTTITINGETFTFTGKSFPILAAEISRAIPEVNVTSGISTVPVADDLALYVGDTTPDGGVVVRFKGLAIQTTERTRIRLLKPHQEVWLGAWWPRINTGTFRTTIKGVRYTFSVPEYDNQAWSQRLGKPYMEHNLATAKVLSNRVVSLPRGPVVGEPGLITLYKEGVELNSSVIDDIDEANRLVYLTEDLNLGDRITADYVYHEKSYIYHGINLNPSLQHSPYLVNQFVLFYILPWKSGEGIKRYSVVNHVIGTGIASCLGQLPESQDDPIVVLGALRTRQIEEASDINVQDARIQGGGVKDGIDAELIEPEAMFYTDIGNIDGRAYPGNSVIISRIPKVILDTFSHHDIMNIAHKHVALGTVNLVDYV